MKLRDIAAQLKRLEVDMSESFLVHYILATLPSAYGAFKVSYNTHKEKWSINELMTMCVQEENRLSMDLGESAFTVTHGKDQKSHKPKGKGKLSATGGIKKDPKDIRCFFCNKRGHVKKDCLKYPIWLEKKGYAKPKEANTK
ncbi:uncharacterized protein LOC124944394 [Impatiens glandulifera]|uniref:uncharacterized protein LOC124944394 n=1 Tax=Impatiens glandulifera TaxID=253017 RepID=UPI001FB0BC38|nr:uncharacterized protein LOC124944394 [Impatiens glandulifera]